MLGSCVVLSALLRINVNGMSHFRSPGAAAVSRVKCLSLSLIYVTPHLAVQGCRNESTIVLHEGLFKDLHRYCSQSLSVESTLSGYFLSAYTLVPTVMMDDICLHYKCKENKN